MGTGKLLGEAVDVVEVAVGLVLVLLVQLGIVVGFVVEFALVTDGSDSGRCLTGSDGRNCG